MKTFTLAEIESYLDALANNPDFAGHVAALRTLLNDGITAAEIGFLTRWRFPQPMLDVLVAARDVNREPVIIG